MYVLVNVHMLCIHVCMHVFVNVYACFHACIYEHMCALVCVCMCGCLCVCMCGCLIPVSLSCISTWLQTVVYYIKMNKLHAIIVRVAVDCVLTGLPGEVVLRNVKCLNHSYSLDPALDRMLHLLLLDVCNI